MCSLKIEYKFAYDNWNCIAVFNCPPSSVLCPLTKSFLWGANGELTAVSVSSVQSVYLPAYDGNRNITAYIDASDGNIAASYEYSPSGGTISKSGPEADNMTFGFASYYLDPETNLIYYGYRYYSPETGRFVNRDPIEESGGVGLYVYGNNDLINNWDYLGLALYAFDGTANLPEHNTNVWLTYDTGYTHNKIGKSRYLEGIGNDQEF